MLCAILIAIWAPAWASLLTQEAQGWDFVPGERQLFYDDFTDMKPGAQPPHWKVRKSVVRLSTAGRLVATEDVTLRPNLVKWPQNFTLEQEFLIEKAAAEPVMTWFFGDPEEGYEWKVMLEFYSDGSCVIDAATHAERLANAPCRYEPARPLKLNLWMQGGRLRAYLGAERLFDVNQVNAAKWKEGWLELQTSEGPVHFSFFRIAESAPDLSQTLFSTGRFVTRGIQFDLNSDLIKPESAPVLKLVADAMKADPAMKLRIEGHTDSSGDAAKNMELSARRAESVKRELVGRYGIDAGRLTAAGLGASKPVADNATPAGRAENRRVEFVKM